MRVSQNLEKYKKSQYMYNINHKTSTIWQKNILIFYVFQFNVINQSLCKILVKYTRGLVFPWNRLIFQTHWVVQSDKPVTKSKRTTMLPWTASKISWRRHGKQVVGSGHISRYFIPQICGTMLDLCRVVACLMSNHLVHRNNNGVWWSENKIYVLL